MVDAQKYGPWALITGGSEGVGSAFARQLAAAGINLVLVARKPGPLEATAEECRALGVEVRTLSIDLATPTAADEVVAQVGADLEIGLLIHNAGANLYNAEFIGGDLASFRTVIDLNVTTMMGLVHHYGGGMRDRGHGGILLVGSMVGYLGSARHTTYGG